MSGFLRGGPRPVNNILGGIRVQTSLQGVPIPIVYGRTRIAGNLVWYGDFIAKPATSGKKGYTGGAGSGKKGGGQYDYGAAIIIGLCQGPISNLGSIWSTQGNLPINETSETYTVPGPGGSYTATQAATYLSDFGVTRGDPYSVTANDFGSPGSVVLTGTQQTPMVAGSVSAGHYSRSGAVYTFSAADAGKTMTITYSYAPPITSGGLAQDPIVTVGFSFFNGALGQAIWSYLTSNHLAQAIPYSGLAFVATPEFDLGMSGTIPNLSFEVYGILPFGSGAGDSNPSDVLSDLLTNTIYGCGIDPSLIGSMTQYSNYCLANGLVISPALDSVRTAADYIKEILDATNSEIIESGGKLLVVPYGDTTVVANGVTFTPNTQPIYDLTVDDFIRSGSQPPVQVERPTIQDAYNSVRVEYLDRGNSYNPSIVEAQDLQAIDSYKYRPEGTRQYHMFTGQTAAAKCAATALARLVYIRNKFRFKLPQKYILLDPMDLVTVTVPELGYDKQPVRIISIDEQPDRTLDIQAEEFPWGTSGPTLYPKQALAPGGPNAYAPPGSVNTPIMFEALSRLNNQIGHTVWFGLSGGAFGFSQLYTDAFARSLLGAGWGTQDTTMLINASIDVGAGTSGGVTNSNYFNSAISADQSSAAVISAVGANVVGGTTQDIVGVAARMSNSAKTYYSLRAFSPGAGSGFSPSLELWKTVAGASTLLVSVSPSSINVNDAIELRCVGTTITGLLNGTVLITATDSSIAAGLAGIYGEKTSAGLAPMRIKNWSASSHRLNANPNWGGCRVWMSDDGTNYQQVATAIGVTKMGALTAILASHADPDTADTLSVDLTESAGILESVTSAQADLFASLCYVDGELIAYQNATLTSAFNFDLATKLRRGVYGSVIGSHAIGSQFMLLDETVEGWDYDVGLIGKTVHFKFTSFNRSGLVEENLADVTDYTFTLTGASIGLLTPAHSSYRPTSNPLTAHDAGASATINIASFAMRVPGMADLPFGSGAISGLLYNTLYYVYFDNAGFVALPSPSYLASQTKEDAIDAAGRMFVGSIFTPVAGGIDTVGNNDGGGGAQIGMLNTLSMSLSSNQFTSGTGTITNPNNAVDGNPTTFCQLQVTAAVGVNAANMVLVGPPGISRAYKSRKLKLLIEIPTNSLSPAGASLALASYGTLGIDNTGVLVGTVTPIYSIAPGTTVPLTLYSVDLPATINPSQVAISFFTVAQGSTSGTLTVNVHDAYIEAEE